MSMADWFREVFSDDHPISANVARDYMREHGNDPFLPPKPRPRLVSATKAPSREAFAVWRDDPVTQFVFMAYRNQQAECREAWDQLSWQGGFSDQEKLNELRARADTYAALEGSDYEAFCEAVGVEPEPEPNAA